jgi:hypothetical protein
VKFLKGKLFSRLHDVMVFAMQNLVSRPCAPSTKKEKAKKTHVRPFCVTLLTLHPMMCHKGWIPYFLPSAEHLSLNLMASVWLLVGCT